MLKTIFENLNILATGDSGVSKAVSTLFGKEGLIEGCRLLITELEKVLPSDCIQNMAQNPSKKRRVSISSAWPSKENKVKKLREEIARYRETITLALTTELTQDIKDIKTRGSKMHDILTDNQRQEVYKWLQHTDPSPLHNRAQKHYEPETGNWMLRSPEWANWLDAKQRCLWIHGIPGAGKTVLMSYLIEQIKKHCGESPKGKFAYVYYYCYFGRNQDEAVPFLQWLLCQLCRQADLVPGNVYTMYKYGGEPSVVDLLNALEDILDAFEITYVIVDALDESNPREDLLKVFRDFITDSRFRKLQLLASSREYFGIERVMGEFSVSVSMANPFVEEDIRLHVRSILQSNPKFRRWTQELLAEVEDAVSKGAKGMFRWAVCQIDALQRLKCKRDVVQKALANLPKTLDETYDRIFLSIPKEEHQFVHHALQWIYYHNELNHGKGIPYAILLKAVERSTAGLTGDQDQRFYDKETLRELCGCLINIALEETMGKTTTIAVSFAHYTVREYLDSTRISKNSTDYVNPCKENLKQNLMEIVLSEAQSVGPNELWDEELGLNDEYDTSEALVGDFNVYCMASSLLSLHQWPCEISQQNSLFTLAIDLLNSSRPNFQILCDAVEELECDPDNFLGRYLPMEARFWNVQWSGLPSNIDALCLFNMLCLARENSECLAFAKKFLQGKHTKDLLQTRLNLEMGAYYEDNYDSYIFDGSVIEIFAQLAHDAIEEFKLLLEYGTGLFDSSKVLLLFIGSHDHNPEGACNGYCPVDRLLELGADPKGKGYRVAPLQIAVLCRDFEGVSTLLKAEADPNDTGDPDGTFWEEDTHIGRRFYHLHNASPLYIYRNFTDGWRISGERATGEDLEKIEAILLEYGAKEFSREGEERRR